MRKFSLFFVIFLLVGALLPAPAAQAAGAEGESGPVRVALSVGNFSTLTIAVEGRYSCLDTVFSGGTLTVRTTADGGVFVAHSALGELGRGDSVTVVREETSVWAAFLTLENSRYGTTKYLGDMIFSQNEHGAVRAVNRVGMRAYLYGVVNGELSPDHPEAALSAQAVAAKGFALSCLDPSEPYDLDDTPTCQVYKGYVPANETVMAAVDAVADVLMTFEGEIVRCYYCTSNGGQTLTPRMRWGKDTGQSAVYEMGYDEYDLAGSESTVRLFVPEDAAAMPPALYAFLLAQAQRLAPEITAIRAVTDLTGYYRAGDGVGSYVEPVDRAPQEQAVAALLCTDANGNTRALAVSFMLYALVEAGVVDCPGANVWFVQKAAGGGASIVFSKAIGHRVGMSHYGLLEMAAQGFTYEEILCFYYPGATLTTDSRYEAERAAAAGYTPAPTALAAGPMENATKPTAGEGGKTEPDGGAASPAAAQATPAAADHPASGTAANGTGTVSPAEGTASAAAPTPRPARITVVPNDGSNAGGLVGFFERLGELLFSN